MSGPLLSDDELQTVKNWIVGIDQGTWNPTQATKWHLAALLQRVVLHDTANRSQADEDDQGDQHWSFA